MAKRYGAMALVILLTVAFAAPVYATSTDSMLKKLGRGLCNCVTFPLELPEQIKRTNNTDGPMAAMTVGVVKGIAMTGLRGLVGMYEVASFPIPMPKGYTPILTDPEFFFEDSNY